MPSMPVPSDPFANFDIFERGYIPETSFPVQTPQSSQPSNFHSNVLTDREQYGATPDSMGSGSSYNSGLMSVTDSFRNATPGLTPQSSILPGGGFDSPCQRGSEYRRENVQRKPKGGDACPLNWWKADSGPAGNVGSNSKGDGNGVGVGSDARWNLLAHAQNLLRGEKERTGVPAAGEDDGSFVEKVAAPIALAVQHSASRLQFSPLVLQPHKTHQAQPERYHHQQPQQQQQQQQQQQRQQQQQQQEQRDYQPSQYLAPQQADSYPQPEQQCYYSQAQDRGYLPPPSQHQQQQQQRQQFSHQQHFSHQQYKQFSQQQPLRRMVQDEQEQHLQRRRQQQQQQQQQFLLLQAQHAQPPQQQNQHPARAPLQQYHQDGGEPDQPSKSGYWWKLDAEPPLPLSGVNGNGSFGRFSGGDGYTVAPVVLGGTGTMATMAGMAATGVMAVAAQRPESRVRAKVVGATQRGSGLARHTVFKIDVVDRAARTSFTILRRYREFKELHRALEQAFKSLQAVTLPEMPPKELYGGRHKSVVSKRLVALSVYLDQLCAVREVRDEESFQHFLSADDADTAVPAPPLAPPAVPSAFERTYGRECILAEGTLRVKEWSGPAKGVVNFVEAGLGVVGWSSFYAVACQGPQLYFFKGGPEVDPSAPSWTLPDTSTLGTQVRVKRVELWGQNTQKDKKRLLALMWGNRTLLCQVASEEELARWAAAIDRYADVRPPTQQRTEATDKSTSIELKAKGAAAIAAGTVSRNAFYEDTEHNAFWSGL